MSIVISDTSPIRALNHLGLITLLEKLYGQVFIPSEVAAELRCTTRRFAAFDPESHPFFKIESPSDQAKVHLLAERLDSGEAAALILAIERQADYVLIDERAGRRVARELGLTAVGVLGILSEAKRRSYIEALKPLIDRLESELDFRLSRELVADVLKRADE